MDPFEIAGLPLHPLIVHAVVVLTPLTALALVLGALFPAVRRRLGIVTPLAALVVAVLVPVTISAGESLKQLVGPLPEVLRHEALGRMLPPWTAAMFVVAAVQRAWYRSRKAPSGPERSRTERIASIVFALLAVIAATGSTVMVVLIGESGARSVWGG